MEDEQARCTQKESKTSVIEWTLVYKELRYDTVISGKNTAHTRAHTNARTRSLFLIQLTKVECSLDLCCDRHPRRLSRAATSSLPLHHPPAPL